jgi:iron complex outermembrane recepter protein
MRSDLKLGVSIFAMAAISALGTAAANAQAADSSSVEAVTVTGTSIRGVAPIGENLITVGQEDIEAVAPVTVTEMLSSVPAITGMGSDGRGMNGNGGPGSTVYIHQVGESADNATLVLMDGHRLPEEGAGPTDNAAVDPNLIPVNMIQRVDVLATGASATYGADAIAGVVNFITRTSFDGVQLHYQAQVEHGASVGNVGDVLIGKSWDGGAGSVMMSYDYQYEGMISDLSVPQTNPLAQAPRAAAAGVATTTGVSTNFGNFYCNSASIQPGGSGPIYINGGTTSVANAQANAPCSQWADASLIPKEKTQHAMIKFHQTLASNLDFTAMILGVQQQTQQQVPAGTIEATVFGAGPQANPFYVNPPGVTATSQNIYYDFDGLTGPTYAANENQAFVASADLLWKINDNWSLDMLANAGTDTANIQETYLFTPGVNSSLATLGLNGSNNSSGTIQTASGTSTSVANTQSTINNLPLTTSNAIDVWDPVSTNKTSASELAILRNTANNNGLDMGTNSTEQYRAIANGTLFDLRAGPLKVAIGVEEYVQHRSDKTVTPGGAGPSTSSSDYTTFDFHRDDNAEFIETDIPIVDPTMGVPFMQKFEVDAAIRTDDYSDVGRTTNPKLSFNWDTIDGLRLRGNWSTSFVPVDLSHEVPAGQVVGTAKSTTISSLPVANYPQVTLLGIPGCTTASITCNTSTLQGLSSVALNQNLQPMKGHGWSLGFDYTPSYLPGFVANLSWWRADLVGGATAASSQIDALNPLLNNRIHLYPGCATQAQITSTTLGAPITTAVPSCVSFIELSQTTNLLNYWASGLDVNLAYSFDTDFGAITLADTLSQNLTFQAGYGDPALTGVPPAYLRSEINNSVGLQPAAPNVGTQMRGHIDWALSDYRASFFVNYTGGYRNVGSTAATAVEENQYDVYNGLGGDPVKSFVTFDLHLGYTFETPYLGSDLLSITVRNLLNTYPPYFNGADGNNASYQVGYDSFVASPIGRIVEVGLTAKF